MPGRFCPSTSASRPASRRRRYLHQTVEVEVIGEDQAPGSPGSGPDRRFQYTLRKVQPGVYGLQVQAINGMGMSDLSPPGEVSVPAGPPRADFALDDARYGVDML